MMHLDNFFTFMFFSKRRLESCQFPALTYSQHRDNILYLAFPTCHVPAHMVLVRGGGPGHSCRSLWSCSNCSWWGIFPATPLGSSGFGFSSPVLSPSRSASCADNTLRLLALGCCGDPFELLKWRKMGKIMCGNSQGRTLKRQFWSKGMRSSLMLNF